MLRFTESRYRFPILERRVNLTLPLSALGRGGNGKGNLRSEGNPRVALKTESLTWDKEQSILYEPGGWAAQIVRENRNKLADAIPHIALPGVLAPGAADERRRAASSGPTLYKNVSFMQDSHSNVIKRDLFVLVRTRDAGRNCAPRRRSSSRTTRWVGLSPTGWCSVHTMGRGPEKPCKPAVGRATILAAANHTLGSGCL